jgi:GntR family transcriptional regulator, transcriptional repressor for pyruvate dehydrogenase complex
MLTPFSRLNYSLPNWSGHLTEPFHPCPSTAPPARAILPMPIQTIEPRRLYRQIADQVRGLLERGEYPAGSRLPPERDLAVQLGVSRPSVREALIALELEGRVEVRMGSGIYVRPLGAARPGPVGDEAPLETIRARALIEGALAAHAATHMKKAQIAALRDAVALMAHDVARGDTPTRGDRLFHQRIAESAQNSVIERIVGELFDERHNPLSEQLGSHFETARSWQRAIAEHEAVIDAIASRSPEAARAAMAAHLGQSHDRFTASIAPATPATHRPTSRPTPRRAPRKAA